MYVPKLKFSEWIPWKKRGRFKRAYFPGIYMIAITRKNLEGMKPHHRDVKYIGMTNSKTGLYGRWNQFDQSIKGRPGHSGGWTVYYDLGSYNRWKKRLGLYVAAMPLKCDVDKKLRKPGDLHVMGLIAYLEYFALAEYKRKTGKEPKYNTK